jgi:hypothetical protein
VLLIALRFSVAVGGAWHFAAIGEAGWNAKIADRLGRRRQRFEASDAIARIVLERVNESQPQA